MADLWRGSHLSNSACIQHFTQLAHVPKDRAPPKLDGCRPMLGLYTAPYGGARTAEQRHNDWKAYVRAIGQAVKVLERLKHCRRKGAATIVYSLRQRSDHHAVCGSGVVLIAMHANSLRPPAPQDCGFTETTTASQ